MLNWWRMGWIWVALGLMLLVSVVMFRGVSPAFNRLRKAVGSPYTEGGKRHPAQEPLSAAELETLFGSLNMLPMVVIGVVILTAILYLMRFKPF
jgi:amino acid transporter